MSKKFFYLMSFILLFLLTFQNVNAYCKDDNKDNSNKKVVSNKRTRRYNNTYER